MPSRQLTDKLIVMLLKILITRNLFFAFSSRHPYSIVESNLILYMTRPYYGVITKVVNLIKRFCFSRSWLKGIIVWEVSARSYSRTFLNWTEIGRLVFTKGIWRYSFSHSTGAGIIISYWNFVGKISSFSALKRVFLDLVHSFYFVVARERVLILFYLSISR